MTKKRFTSDYNGDETLLTHFLEDGKPLTKQELMDLLNALHEENGQLAKEKERYKRLSEIRREEINNRILTIKEFIENCSDNKVKKILEDLFYSEVKEYELSTQNRKLLYENEQLKSEINILKTTIGRNEAYIERLTHKSEWHN